MNTDLGLWVLFDLGGVIVRLGDVTPFMAMARITSETELRRRWLGSPWLTGLERGLCPPVDFATGIVGEWSLPVTPGTFLEMFEAWVEGVHEGAEELVAEVRRHANVACLSNSNIVHWRRMCSEWHLDDLFTTRFLSHEIGLAKPGTPVFEHVVRALGVPLNDVVLLDDDELNVATASAAGLQAFRVRGPDEARSALVSLGVLQGR